MTILTSLPFSVAISGETALAALCASLSAGQHSIALNPTWTGGDTPAGDDLNWINKFAYDPGLRRAYMAGKIQNNDTAMLHGFYDEDTNTWLCENCGFDEAGHVYDFIDMDENGNGWIAPGGGRSPFLWKVAWTKGQPLAQPSIASVSADGSPIDGIVKQGTGHPNFISNAGAMCRHPNLFGPGDGGHVIVCHLGIAAWREADNTFHVLVSGEFNNPNVPACVYSRGLGAAIATINASGLCYRIHDINTIVSSNEAGLDPTPVNVGPDTGGNILACLVDDPFERATMWLLEKSGTGRVWLYVSGSWVLQGFTHPANADDSNNENWMASPLRTRGCFMFLERQAGALPRTRVWRPLATSLS